MSYKRYIEAAEVNSFVYCKRSWRLQRRKAPSRYEAERAQGTQLHELHGRRVRSAVRIGRLATWCAVVAVILLGLGLLVILR